jgi:DNA-directed RNA polymerase specialized sigma24 family protein
MTENVIVKQLQGIAARLTDDSELQKDLMQEMFVHLVRVQTAEPGQTLSWYLKSCEFHARRCLRLRGGIDLPERSGDETLPGADKHRGNGAHTPAKVDQIVIQGEVITSDTLDLILPQLSDMQQRVLFLLMKGCGVREAARELGVTHPAVIKHRKKIARLARELLQESEGIGVAVAVQNGANGNGNGNSNGNGGTPHTS